MSGNLRTDMKLTYRQGNKALWKGGMPAYIRILPWCLVFNAFASIMMTMSGSDDCLPSQDIPMLLLVSKFYLFESSLQYIIHEHSTTSNFKKSVYVAPLSPNAKSHLFDKWYIEESSKPWHHWEWLIIKMLSLTSSALINSIATSMFLTRTWTGLLLFVLAMQYLRSSRKTPLSTHHYIVKKNTRCAITFDSNFMISSRSSL